MYPSTLIIYYGIIIIIFTGDGLLFMYHDTKRKKPFPFLFLSVVVSILYNTINTYHTDYVCICNKNTDTFSYVSIDSTLL